MGKIAEAFVEITSKTDNLDKGLKGAEDRLNGFVASTQAMMVRLGAIMAAGGAVKIFKDIAESGSDLGETMSKTQQVFGAATGKINAMADDMAQKFGAVRKTTLDAASMFGLVAQGAGLTEMASAGLSEKLVRLADDASSFFNVPLDVALEKIRAGMVGESEPLRAFGVLLSEAAVKAKALQSGIIESNRELTEQEKVMARVLVIQEGLAKASGDHERTMGSYANQVRKLAGEFENLKASMGAVLAPAAASVLQQLQQGLMVNPGKHFQEDLKGPSQEAADKAAGVVGAEGIAGGQSGPQKIANQRMADALNMRMAEQRARDQKAFDDKREGGGGFGAFGMLGSFGMAMNQKADVKGIDKQMAALQRGKWQGGLQQMGADDFMRSAQSTVLDDTNKKQLDELKAMKDALIKIRDNTAIRTANQSIGLIAKGRE